MCRHYKTAVLLIEFDQDRAFALQVMTPSLRFGPKWPEAVSLCHPLLNPSRATGLVPMQPSPASFSNTRLGFFDESNQTREPERSRRQSLALVRIPSLRRLG